MHRQGARTAGDTGPYSQTSQSQINKQAHHAPQGHHDEPCAQPRREKNFSEPSSHQPVGFLRQLFGKDFDTGDLVVILLLLLMAGDSEEDRSNALLTIALYFMM